VRSSLALLGLLPVLLPVLAVAQSQSRSATDAGAGVLTKAPAVLKEVEAVFPPEFADAGIGGTVVMEIDVGEDGRVLDARVLGSAGQAFDDAALAAVRSFEFSPAEVDGRPAAVRLQYSYTFLFRPQVVEAPVASDGGAPAGLVNFRGRVVRRGTREPVAGAQVVVGGSADEAALEAVTDEAGAFELTGVPAGVARVTVASSEFATFSVEESFVEGRRTEVTYFLRQKASGAYETLVRAPKERREVAQVTITQEEIRLIPGTAGDAFRVVQNLPGVARAPFGLGFLVVRGGKSWDTRTYVDETPVPQLFHFGGLFSTYNANLLQDLSFQAGSFNADYGRAIAGLVTAEARTPSTKGFHGYVDINLVDSSALIEGPIAKGWSFALSARRSYIDAVLPAVLNLIPGANDAIRFTLAPRYWDYQARLEYRQGRTRFFVSFFGSSDALVAALPNPTIDPEGRGEFGTSVAYNKLLFGFDYRFSDVVDLRTRTSFGLDEYGFTLGSDLYAKSRQYPIVTRDTVTVRLPSLKAELALGVDVQLFPYVVDVQGTDFPRLNQVPDPFTSRRLIAEHSTRFTAEPAAFADLVLKPLDALKIVAGVRGDYNSTIHQAWVDPRLAVFFQAHPQVLLKGAVGLYHQPPDYRSGQLLEKFGNPELKAEGARQYMLGTEVRFTDAISLDVQLYYKDLFDQVRSTLGDTSGVVDSGVSTPPYLNTGHGRSYGAEVLLRHALTRNFFGWVSYSLSRTERDLSGGQSYGLSQFDQPHNLVVMASYKLPYDFIVGAKVRYTSGPLNRPVVGTVYDANANYYFPVQDSTYSRRLPDFFQLDVRVDKRFVFQDWMLAIYLDVQNATYRKNVEGVVNSYDYSQEAFLTGLPILPVLGLRGEW